jgi:dCMP deaminase
MSNWDLRFIELSSHVAAWSKDRSRESGCVIVGPNREIRTTGYNGFPRGISDDIEERHDRPAKYMWTEHAERNAIYNAARMGLSLESCTAYINWYPCVDCARALIQSGISRLVVASEPNFSDPTYGEGFRVADQMFYEAEVKVDCLNLYESPKQKELK